MPKRMSIVPRKIIDCCHNCPHFMGAYPSSMAHCNYPGITHGGWEEDVATAHDKAPWVIPAWCPLDSHYDPEKGE